MEIIDWRRVEVGREAGSSPAQPGYRHTWERLTGNKGGREGIHWGELSTQSLGMRNQNISADSHQQKWD